MAMTIEQKKVITPKFRVSFPNVFNPKSFDGQPAKYSVTMLFDKGADLSAMKTAAKNAAIEKWGPDQKTWPAFKNPVFRDGNEMGDPSYKDQIVVRASAKMRPGVVNADRSVIVEDDGLFYAGCYARASLIAFAYDNKGNKGVGFALQNLQKMGDGEPLSGRKSAADEFDAVGVSASGANDDADDFI